MKERDKIIDFLRGFSILIIIMIHVVAKYVSFYFPSLIWRYLHFVEALMVFCSGASLIYSHSSFKNMKEIFSFIKKRMIRFYIPWWFFLIVFLSANFIFDLLAHLPFRFSLIYILKSAFLFGIAGGLGYGWILLLLLVFSILYPFVLKSAEKIGYQRMFFIIILVSFGMHYFYSMKSLDNPIYSIYYLQYLLPFFLGMCYAKKIKINLSIIAIFYLLIYISLIFINLNSGKSVVFTDFSYPPNLFFMSYGIFMSIFLVSILKIKYLRPLLENKISNFYSVNSLWIYMWHILIMGIIYRFLLPFGFMNNEPWWIFRFFLVLLLSSFIYLIQKKIITKLIKTRLALFL